MNRFVLPHLAALLGIALVFGTMDRAQAQLQLKTHPVNRLSGGPLPDGGSPPVVTPQFAGAAPVTTGSAPLNSDPSPLSTTLTSRYPSAVYLDPASSQPTGKAAVLRRSTYGYSFAGGTPRYYLGDVIDVPLTKADRTTPAPAGYWRAEPVHPGEIINHLSGGPETPIAPGEVETAYFSPHAGRVFATQPGLVSIKWVSRLPEADGRYRFFNDTFGVSSVTRLPSRTLYWTEKSFTGPPANLPSGRIVTTNIVYTPFFPRSVAEEFHPVGSPPNPNPDLNPPGELRTLWLDNVNGEKTLHAYNIEGRVFVEYLGALNPDGITHEFLGADIVEVSRSAIQTVRTVALGEQITPQEDDPSLIASPVGGSINPRFGNLTRSDGSIVYYAERESLNPDNVQFFWLEDLDANISLLPGAAAPGLSIRWPKFLNKYIQVWPDDIDRFAHVVVPEGGSDPATGVRFPGGTVPQVIFQDDGLLTEARIDLTTQRFVVTPALDGLNRSLLKFVNGHNVWYVRIYTQDESRPGFEESDRVPHSAASATVAERIERPSDAYATAGYIAHGTGFQPEAYLDPFTAGVDAAGAGAIIPVNAVPGNDQLTVWWFRPVVAPDANFQTFYVPAKRQTYQIAYPTDPDTIVLASNRGSGVLPAVEKIGSLYIQNDPNLPGYNPNEEHAVFLNDTVWALRDDLNLTGNTAATYTSQPFALLSYTDLDDHRPRMHAFKILRETTEYFFDYPVTAGLILPPPMPLELLPLPIDANGVVRNVEVTPANIDPRPDTSAPASYDSFTYEDRKGYHWVYRGPHDGGNPAISFQFYYTMRADFFVPGVAQQPAAGTILPYLRPLDPNGVPLGHQVTGTPLTIRYRPQWPDGLPELRVAETLTLPKFGLPGVRGQTSAELLYQQSIAKIGAVKPSAILHDPTRQKSVKLDAPAVGLSALPASARTTGSLGKIYFQGIPPHLQKRFYYDQLVGSKGSLVLKGEFVDEVAGEKYLHLNVLSAADELALKGIALDDDNDKAKWDAAIDALNSRLETFIENPARRGTYTVDSARTRDIGENDLADIQDSDTAVDSYALTATGKGAGYVTLLFNDGEAFTPEGEPVTMKVIKVAPQLYTGELKVLESGNPLDEQVTLRHSSDFAARPEDYEFEWRYSPPGDGTAPPTYSTTMAIALGDPSFSSSNTWSVTRNPSPSTGGAAGVARVIRISGGDPGEGLDTTGTFLYAIAVGHPGAVGSIGDASFTDDLVPGVTVTAPNVIPFWAAPNFGDTPADTVLKEVLKSIRWANTADPDPERRKVKLDLANLIPGRSYKLQLMFMESTILHRSFDVIVEGSRIVNDLVTRDPLNPQSAAGVVYEFTAQDTTLNVVLDGSDVAPIAAAGLDTNPILSAVTLEQTAVPALASLPSSLVIHDSAYDPAGDPPGLILKNTQGVDFSGGVSAQIVFSDSLSDLDGFVLYVNGVAALANNAPGFANTDATTGLSPNGLTRQFNVSPNYFSQGPNTIEVALYTIADTGRASQINFRLEGSIETDLVDVPGTPWSMPDGTLSNVTIVGGDPTAPLGSPLLTLTDNFFTMRYRPKPGTGNVAGEGWSRWMPPKLVEGWIKRVLKGINPFNQRMTDLLNNPVNTDVSLLTQAGTRWEGDVALTLENINDFGLIEIYETVLNRGKNLSIDRGYDYEGANNALLLAAGYLNDLYTILGNEAFADAANPTISLDDQSTVTEVNTSRFSFESQVSSVLQEELSLLRGRDDFLDPSVQVAPFYNRLIWNYTRGINAGEALYAVNYNIKEKAGSPTADGVLDAADAQRMFPQGHGDAYGHYLSALKGYFRLLTNPKFTWVPRSEPISVLGQTVQVDYLDERKFAAAGAHLAETVKQVIALTHREAYRDDPAEGWSHFRDGKPNPRTGTTRHFGLDEWCSRGQQGNYFDWVVGNAILPDEDTNPAHSGIQIIDRTTVPELDVMAAAATSIQTSMDNANAHLNPLGLSPGAIAFDLSPSELQDGHSHYEQIHDRALRSVLNARGAFNQAATMTRLLRNQENQIDEYNTSIVSQESAYVKQMIEIFGSPYSGDMGPGKKYSQDYAGPDTEHWFVIDRPTDMVDTTRPETITVNVPVNIQHFTGNAIEDIRNSFATQTAEKTYTIQPNRFVQYADVFDPGLGQRPRTGRLQQALLDAHQAQLALSKANSDLGGLIDRFRREHERFLEMLEAHRRTMTLKADTSDAVLSLERTITGLSETASFLKVGADFATKIGDALQEGIPEHLGPFTFSAGSAPKSAAKLSGALVGLGLAIGAQALDSSAAGLQLNISRALSDLEGKLDAIGFEEDERQAFYEYELLYVDIYSYNFIIADLATNYQRATEQVNNVLAEGVAIRASRESFRQRAAGIIQGYRTRDLGFRTFRNEALEQYRSLFDLASRYTYLSAKSYDYETGLLGTPEGRAVISGIVASRSLGDLTGDIPQATTSALGDAGLAGTMARLQADWAVAKGRLGINNPDQNGTVFSLRHELYRILDDPGSTSDDDQWQQELQQHIFSNILLDADVARYCRNIRKPDGSPVAGIVIPFSTTITHGKNFFGLPLAGGDHAFTPSNFATKIYSAGMIFKGYVGMDNYASGSVNATQPASGSPQALSATPYAYLIPVGSDAMLAPAFGDTGIIRTWKVHDQALPLPFNLGANAFSDTQFFDADGTLSSQPWILRKHQAFRAVDDPTLFYSRVPQEFTSSRLIGRSAWNSEWMIVIPAYTLMDDEEEGLDRFAATVTDIQLFLRTYSNSGN